MADSILSYTIDDFFKTTPVGSIDRALGNNLYGINHRQVAAILPSNKDMYGMTFFVRPQLNLTSDNVANQRPLYALLNNNETSIQRFVRCTLDPRLMYPNGSGDKDAPVISCPLVDPLQAFIPILSNNLKSISGWSDMTVPTFTSAKGLYQEEYCQADGITKIYSSSDIDATFNNVRGNPILYLFYIWLSYQANVFEGTMLPYPDFVSENRIDYMTRIYRIVLDHRKKYITEMSATGVSFPITLPIGQFFDYNEENPYNTQAKEITIRFKSLGLQYVDDILVMEFNKTVCIFNPNMIDANRQNMMIKIDQDLLIYFNHRGYPRINQNNYELEWWIPLDTYNSHVAKLIETGLIATNTLQDVTETGD